MIFPDNWFGIFIDTGSSVAIDNEEVSGDNGLSGGQELNDLMENAINDSGKLRTVVSS